MKEKLNTKKVKIIIFAILMLLLVAVLTLAFNTAESSKFLSMFQGKESEFLASSGVQKIILNQDGGSNNFDFDDLYVSDGVVYYEENCAASVDYLREHQIPIKQGYRFIGYKIGNDTVINANGTINTDLINKYWNEYSGGTYTLTANYERLLVGRVQTITIGKQGGTGGTDYLYVKDGIVYGDKNCTTQISKITMPTKAGYKCIGSTGSFTENKRNIAEDGTIDSDFFFYLYYVEQYKNSANFNIQDRDISLEWEEREVQTITLNKNGGTSGTSNIYVSEGVAYSDSNCQNKITKITVPTKSGYKFKGYESKYGNIIDEDGMINSYAINTIWGNGTKEDYEVTAQWEEVTLILGASSGTGTALSGTGYVGGDNITAGIGGSNYGTLSVKSSNASIATASISGTTLTITPKAAGTATITVKEGNANKTVTYTITVKATSIGLSSTSGTCYIGGNNLTSTISGSNMGILSATSDKTNIATASISGTTLTITPKAAGTATITVKEGNGNKTVDYIVTVKATSINLNPTSGYVKEGGNITSTITGTNMGTLSITNTNTNVATASINGSTLIIQGVKAGTATITVKEGNGNKTATFNVTVTKLTIAPTSKTLDLSGTKTVTITATKENAGTVSWVSSNPNVATVSATTGDSIVVTGKSNGITTITATGANGSPTATCQITVQTTPTQVTLNKTSVTIDKSTNNEVDLMATIAPGTANVQKGLTWSTNKPEVVKIDKTTGETTKVTGVSNGTATITVRTENGKTASCEVTVQTTPTQVTLNKTSVTIDKSTNNEVDLMATILPETANVQKRLTWTSSNPEIATIDKTTGETTKVTGVSNGKTTITVTTENGKTANCEVTVQTTPTAVTLNKTNVTLDISEVNDIDLIATIAPETANVQKGLTWTSSNPEIATIDKTTGETTKVTGVSNGKTTITVTTENGKTASCEITVQTSPKQMNIVGDRYIAKGDSTTYFVTFLPELTTTELITWTSSNEEVATIEEMNEDSAIIKALKEGETRITAKTENGTSSTMKIIVTSLKIKPEEAIIDLTENNTITLETEKSNAGNINWQIKEESIASLSATKGDSIEVTGIKNGETTITATGKNGNPESTIKLKVQTSPAEITLDKTDVVFDLSTSEETAKEIQLNAIIQPDTANVNRNLTWTSDNEEVAIVDENGKVTAIKNGTATIKVMTENRKEAICQVTVQTTPTQIALDKTNVVLDLSATDENTSEKNLMKEIQLNATIEPGTANVDTNLTWSSDNEEVAMVDENGKVKAVSNGTATIKVSTENEKEATCQVTVQTTPTRVILNQTNIIFDLSNVEESAKETQLHATIEPGTANVDTNLTWTSDNEEVATVDENGKVKAVANGRATIKVMTENEKEAICQVTVQTTPTQVILNQTNIIFDLSNVEESAKETQLHATVEPGTANVDTNLTWSSDNEEIATVDENGKVKAVSNGTAIIKVSTENGEEAICQVTVQTTPTQVALDKTNVVLDLSATDENASEESLIKEIQLNATIEPGTANVDTNLTWSSDNEEVATVDENGKVTAIKNGTATITVVTENRKEATCRIMVQTSPSEIKLEETNITLEITEEKQLVATIGENIDTNDKLTWTSDNEEIVTVDENGKVTAVGNGTAIITVITENGKEATCQVTVQTSPTEITLDKTNVVFDLSTPEESAKEVKLNAKIKPSTVNANAELTWTSSDEKVATVDENGKVTAVGNGTATITVTTQNHKTASCEIIVQTSPTQITLDETNITLEITEEKQLVATIGENVNINDKLTWFSDDEEVVTVDENGKITAVRNGTATITVRTENGKEATCQVTVQTSPVQITLDKTKVTLDLSTTDKKEVQLKAIIEPSTVNANTELTWSSNNEKVATVDENGKVMAIANGTAIITVRTKNEKTATCIITILTTKNKIEIDMGKDREEDLKDVLDKDGIDTNKIVKWESSDETIATVDQDGKITGIKNGTVIITATYEDGTKIEYEITITGIPTEQETKWRLGDINLDGNVDVTDLLLLKRHLVAGNKKEWILDADEQKRGDMNQNGTVDITDLLLLKRELVK